MPPGTDLACAALGVPFVGHSRVWDDGRADPFALARRLLTDQGFSAARRVRAHAHARELYGEEAIERLRALTLAGEPEPEPEPETVPA